MMTQIYFDNAATTRVCPEAAEAAVRAMREEFGNPSAMHEKGVEAERIVRGATKTLADILKVKEKEIFYTSGGTESDNWALIGTAQANRRRGNHIIVSSVEHPAVSAPAKYLAEQGFRVTYLPVDGSGVIRPDALEEALAPDTILVSVMAVNNEVGTVQPLAEIGALVRKKCPEAYFHTDAVQAFGKIPVLPGRMKIDMLSVSAHKIHGPKGAGFLYVNDRVKIAPLIRGGGQQGGQRSGTDNVPGIAGMACAAKIVCGRLEENAAHMQKLRDRLAAGLQRLDDVVVRGAGRVENAGGYPAEYAPHILSASFPGVRSEVLLHALEERGIYVSAGSACSSHKRAGSPTLTAMGCGRAEMESALRFSFCENNTAEEVDAALAALAELLPVLRRFTRR